MPDETENPYLRASLPKRILRVMVLGVGMLWRGPLFLARFLWRLPWPVRVLLLVAIVGAGVAGGVLAYGRWQNRKTQQATTDAWVRFGSVAQSSGDLDKLRTILDELLAIRPDDALALARRQMLETLEASPDDGPMQVLLLRTHASSGRKAEAIREARKRYATEPRDWLANAILCEDALDRDDATKVNRYAEALQQPERNSSGLDAGSLLYGIRLLERAGRPTQTCRAFIASRVLPVFRGESVNSLGALDLLSFLSCYAEVLNEPTMRKGLAVYWGPSAKLYAMIGTKAATDERSLGRMIELGSRLADGLTHLANDEQLPQDELPALSKQLEDTIQSACRTLRVLNPKLAISYVGQTLSHARLRETVPAIQTLQEGLEACGNDPQLLQLLVRVADATGSVAPVLDRVWDSANAEPKNLRGWLLAVDASLALRRRDKAIEACQNARKLAPDLVQLIQLEARLWAEAGLPKKAAELLATQPTERIANDPAFLRLAVRVAFENHDLQRVSQLRGIAAQRGWLENSPTLLVAVVQGLSDAHAPADTILSSADGVLAFWPSANAAARVKALTLFANLDPQPLPWPSAEVDTAIRATEFARSTAPTPNPDEATLTSALARLRLLGREERELAGRLVAPWREQTESLTIDQLETLAEIMLDQDQATLAATLLSRRIQSRDLSAGYYVVFARTMHLLSRDADGRQALNLAARLPMTPRQRQSYQATTRKLDAPKTP